MSQGEIQRVETLSIPQPHITHLTVEHVVVPSRYSYAEVIGALEARVGVYGNWEVIPHQLAAMNACWEQVAEITQPLIGTSGFTADHSVCARQSYDRSPYDRTGARGRLVRSAEAAGL